ncbi:MAG: 4Fe-4S ferredoxin [Pseudopedobacter saltans]|uniref:D-lactate dehydrogenase (cytochrome) n=1 Tax=Pseudopedobacter saltans TaxID=151895 RepID=A0A2W5F7U4_9SPHI|nr:MAG: 4Fe-4S ferredoxin [Pseudopedobacter saltans]
MIKEQYQQFISQVSKVIPKERLVTDPLKILAYGTDASFYRLLPQVVVQAHDENEVVSILQNAVALNLPVTFRAAGTSLSGQSITDSILVVASHKWRQYEILDEKGLKVRYQPGVVGSRANIVLKPYGRKIGPDPASINSAMIGGIAANNASGMCCGNAQNTYKTMADIRIVLYDGTILDTADANSRKSFEEKHPEIIAEIIKLRNDIVADPVLYERIQRKFKIKNTTGYSINALVDYEDPIDIIKHLMIGSEGTLAFISNITYETVVDEPFKSCALLIFNTIEAACQAVPYLSQSPAAAVELLDRESIHSVEHHSMAPDYFKTLPESACVLLVECQASTESGRLEKQNGVRQAIVEVPTAFPFEFVAAEKDPKRYSFNWQARKGLLPSVGGLRKTGTTCLIEDVAVPVENLADACIGLKELFKKYDYKDAVLFGHALAGNLHLVFSQDFSDPKEVERYAHLMDELAELIAVKFGGSLKAEHGTGRNMAPFVLKEWGDAAYRIMIRIKDIFDPLHLINPDVIINKNPKIHLENLKPLPASNPIVDKCMECGFCESSCVSEGLTLSPRQRIVVGREIERLKETGENPERLRVFQKESLYNVDETCATDGLCALACPVDIDTGKYVKDLRHSSITEKQEKTAEKFGSKMSLITSGMRSALNVVGGFQSVLGDTIVGGVANGLRTLSGDRIPKWNPYMPKGGRKIKQNIVNGGHENKVVYFASCINRGMGKAKGYKKEDPKLVDMTEKLLAKAGFTIIYPEGINGLCCGMPFSSKGFKEEGDKVSSVLENALLVATENGKYPVLYDMSSCFYTSHEHFSKNVPFKMYDPIQFILEFVMPKLEVRQPRESVTVFPVCSAKKIGAVDGLVELTKMCAKNVKLVDTNCCGFAGDRGFTFPELNEHGQRHLKEQIPAGCSEGYSTNRPCEIGMSEYSGISFKSIFYLVDEVTG